VVISKCMHEIPAGDTDDPDLLLEVDSETRVRAKAAIKTI